MPTNRDEQSVASGHAHWFTTTHWSVVLAAGRESSAQSSAALEALCGAYWYPLYSFIRREGYDSHDAQDLTQGFFARLLEKEYLAGVDREKGKFRSFLLASLKHFLSHERERKHAAKRGGGQVVLSLDDGTAEITYASDLAKDFSPETAFEKQWATNVLQLAFARVREEFIAEDKGQLFEALQPFLAEQTSSGDYKAVAADLGMMPNAVAVSVHRLRQRFRNSVREEVANTVATPDQIEDEMRHLFTVLGR